MRCFIIMLFLAFLLPVAANAEETNELIIQDISRGSPVHQAESYLQTSEKITDEIVSKTAEAKGWCDQPRPEAKPGQILVYWTRNSQGKCLVRNIAVGK